MSIVLPVVLIIAMALVFLVIASFLSVILKGAGASKARRSGTSERFSSTSSIPSPAILCSGWAACFAIIYVGGIVGGDYSWGVLRNAFSRGESRIKYALAKAGALAIGVAIAAFVCLLVGAAMVLIGATILGAGFAPLNLDAGTDFVKAFGLGTLVLFERGAIGFAVTVLLRSQIAGIVVGVILYIAEPFICRPGRRRSARSAHWPVGRRRRCTGRSTCPSPLGPACWPRHTHRFRV